MAKTAIGIADHFDHALLDEVSGALEPGLVKLFANLDRLAPQVHAASEWQGKVEAVPGREHTPSARRVGQRQDRHPSEPRDIHRTDTHRHRRAARAIGRDADAPSLF